ncbi:MAG: late competence development ComFB family protein [Oscillospiraceae bacterium]|nr:late competence development ComFB family protein [Oscillospiraceae bacterium]
MEFVIKNLMETVVESKIKELIPMVDCCKCEKCRMDITAYVLNKLPAKYVSTEKGALFAELDMLDNQHEADVMTHVLKGIELIAQNPHHWTPAEAEENGLKEKKMKFDLNQNTVEPQSAPAVPVEAPQSPAPQNTAAKSDAARVSEDKPAGTGDDASVSPLSRLSGAVKKTAVAPSKNAEQPVHNTQKTVYKDVSETVDEIVEQAINNPESLDEEEETYSSSDFDVFSEK